MNNQTNIERFDDELRRAIGGAEFAPSPDLWSRIEESAVSPAPYSAPLPAARWVAMAAAAVLVAVGLGVWFSPVEPLPTEPLYAAHIEEFIEVGELRAIALKEMTVVHWDKETLGQRDIGTTGQCDKGEVSTEQNNTLIEQIEPTGQSKPTKPTKATKPTEQPKSTEHSKVQSMLKPHRSPIKLSLMVAGGSTSSTTSSGRAPMSSSDDFMPNGYTNLISNERYAPTEAMHHVPVSYAVSVTAPLGGRWSLESGVSYSSLRSEVTMSYSSQAVSQRLQFVGVPLRVKYDLFTRSNISLYGGVGGEIERCISATLNSQSIDEKPWHTSLSGSLGVQYNLTRHFALYAEPEVCYYLTEGELTTIRTESPISVNGRVGLRVMF